MSNILEFLYQKFVDNSDKIQEFFADGFKENKPLIYNSCDLRHSSFKICPIDTNCFPAGFNNLSESSKEIAKKQAKIYLEENFKDVKNIIIIPENHTRNYRYLSNILNLYDILADFANVKIGTLIDEVETNLIIEIDENNKLEVVKLINDNGKIKSYDGFEADLIILNNDLTDQVPQILENLKVDIVPDINLGWHNRMKSTHFDIYNNLANKLAKLIDIDPWLISTLHKSCDEVNFKEQKGFDCLVKKVDEVLLEISKKYQEYNIKDEPYVYVKADNGTYGMAIWPVKSGQEIIEINKKNRNKMNMIKGSIQNTKVMIQEGVKTIDKINNNFAEPMIYLINSQIIGNLFRVNESRNEEISLNSPGANFFDLSNLDENSINLGLDKNKITKIYQIIASLAALAASQENK